jgi:hypothetical protein
MKAKLCDKSSLTPSQPNRQPASHHSLFTFHLSRHTLHHSPFTQLLRNGTVAYSPLIIFHVQYLNITFTHLVLLWRAVMAKEDKEKKDKAEKKEKKEKKDKKDKKNKKKK